ncbi:unnamed protein product [Ceratitis capitata]|uniref:(Mediterranean fruit fly) hypothetical protein n=1 Tax=Ceratitis capitata TaxID=7213 RepID=A0A811VCP7_CERCA|nr:unnamed protein product [Ceratitis capitata]
MIKPLVNEIISKSKNFPFLHGLLVTWLISNPSTSLVEYVNRSTQLLDPHGLWVLVQALETISVEFIATLIAVVYSLAVKRLNPQSDENGLRRVYNYYCTYKVQACPRICFDRWNG